MYVCVCVCVSASKELIDVFLFPSIQPIFFPLSPWAKIERDARAGANQCKRYTDKSVLM